MFRRLSSALAIAVAVSCGDLTPPAARRRLRADFPVMPLFDGDPAGGGGGGGTGDKTYTKADLDAAVAAISAKNTELLGNVRSLKDRYKAFDGIDADADTIKAALGERVTAEEAKKRAAGDFDSWRKEIQASHQTEIEKRDQRVTKMTSVLEKHLIDGTLAQELAAAQGNTKLLIPVLRPQVKMMDVEGEFVPRVVGPSGAPRMKNATEFMSIADLVAEARGVEDFAGAFKAPGTSGGGSNGGGGSASAVGQSGFKETATEVQLTRAQANDTATYRRAREAAGKAGKKIVVGE